MLAQLGMMRPRPGHALLRLLYFLRHAVLLLRRRSSTRQPHRPNIIASSEQRTPQKRPAPPWAGPDLYHAGTGTAVDIEDRFNSRLAPERAPSRRRDDCAEGGVRHAQRRSKASWPLDRLRGRQCGVAI